MTSAVFSSSSVANKRPRRASKRPERALAPSISLRQASEDMSSAAPECIDSCQPLSCQYYFTTKAATILSTLASEGLLLLSLTGLA